MASFDGDLFGLGDCSRSLSPYDRWQVKLLPRSFLTDSTNDLAVSDPTQPYGGPSTEEAFPHQAPDAWRPGVNQDPIFSAGSSQLTWPEDIFAGQEQEWLATPMPETTAAFQGQDLVSGMQLQQPLPLFQEEELRVDPQLYPGTIDPPVLMAADQGTGDLNSMGSSVVVLDAATPQPRLQNELPAARMWHGGMPHPLQQTLPPAVPSQLPQPLPVARGPPTPDKGWEEARRAGPRRHGPLQRCNVAGCQYETKIKEEFRRHVDSVHNHIRRHRCNLCDVKCNDPSSLSKHMRSRAHVVKAQTQGIPAGSSQRRYGCKFCSRHAGERKSFARSDQLRRHLAKCRNCAHVGEHQLPTGYKAGPRGMEDGLLKEGEEWAFVSGDGQ